MAIDELNIDFTKQTSKEIINTVHALHPFLPAYITYGNEFYIVNPYNIKIVDKKGAIGEVVSKDKKSMTIICKDGVALEMDNLKKYTWLSKFMVR